MARYWPTRPGWYGNPDEPGLLRYWDGKAWTTRSRRRPPWVSGAEPFEFDYVEMDRSTEGPVHPHELREPVASGAWSREWLFSWRPRHAERAWDRGGGELSQRFRPAPRPQPPAKLGSARRPLLLMACLVVVAVAAVISSVAVISPYESKGLIQTADQGAESHFTGEASKECLATLPRYRDVLARGMDGPTIASAAHQVDLLRKRLASLDVSPDIVGPVQEWLQTWQQFTDYQRRYASIIGPALRRGAQLVPRNLAHGAELAATPRRGGPIGGAGRHVQL